MSRSAARRLFSVLAATTLVVLLVPPAARADSGVPYTDAAATGTIGFCDVQGHDVTGGKLSDKPFVWLSVGATPATGGLAAPGRTAFLSAYQPRKGVDPGNWSGLTMTASSRYTNVAHPMAQATPISSSLASFVAAFPPQWDGLVQLRLILGGSQRPQQTATYDATDIRISGDSWQVVHGGAEPCRAGSAVSAAVLLNLPGAKGTPKPGAVAPRSSSAATSPTSSASHDPGSRGTAAPGAAAGAPSRAGAGVLSASSTPLVVGLVVAVLLVAAVGLWARQRRGSST